MIKSKGFNPPNNRGKTWDSLDLFEDGKVEFTRAPSVQEAEWKKWKHDQKRGRPKGGARLTKYSITDKLMRFTIQCVKKGDIADASNEVRQLALDKLESVEPAICVLKPHLDDKDFDILDGYKPEVFNTVDIDPNNLVNITSAIRGNISTFATIVRTEEETENLISNGTLDNDCQMAKSIMQSDIVICDVTLSRTKILQLWKAVKILSKILDNANNEEDNNHITTIILISSLLTWADTPEILNNPEFKLHEVYYSLRTCPEAYKPMLLLENELLKLGFKYSSRLRVLIVGTGIIYGPGEEDLAHYLELSLNDNELPVFGSGQNYVPVIHIEDLISFLSTIIHNYPENYEYVFAAEQTLLTQSQIINVICKSLDNEVQPRFVSNKYGLYYDLGDEDVFKLSKNLPIEASYQNIVSWKSQHSFVHSIPSFTRRYFSIKNETKPPCLIVMGPPCDRVSTIIKYLAEILGTELINTSDFLLTYLSHLSSKEVNSRKYSAVEKSVNDLCPMPRGKGLIKVLNRALLQPKVQKNGYIIERYPETYNEAAALYKVIRAIYEKASAIFPQSQIINYTPENLIVFMMDSNDMLKEMDIKTDDNGSVSANFVMKLNNFREKLSDVDSCIEYFNEENLTPKLFNIGEYETEYECAQRVADFIRTSRIKKKAASDPVKEDKLTLPALFSAMLSNYFRKPNFMLAKMNEEENNKDVQIEVKSRWKEHENLLDGQENSSGERNSRSDKIITNEKFHMKLLPEEDNIQTFKAIEQEGALFDTGIIRDKISRPLKGTDGNISQCCVKNMKNWKLANGPTVSKSYSVMSTVHQHKERKRSIVRDNKNASNLSKEKRVSIMNVMAPKIEWSAISNKLLKGVVEGWCKLSDRDSMSDSNGEQKGEEESNSKSSNDVVDNLDDALNEFTNETFEQMEYNQETESSKQLSATDPKKSSIQVKRHDTVTTIIEELIRAGPIYTIENYELYKSWYIFVDPLNDYAGYSFNKSETLDGIFQQCIQIAKNKNAPYEIESICKKNDSKLGSVDDKRVKANIKHGESVQVQQNCCGLKEKYVPTELTENLHKSVSNEYIEEKELNDEIKIIKESSSTESLTDSVVSNHLNYDELSKENYFTLGSPSDTIGLALTSVDFDFPMDSSSNIDQTNWRASNRISEVSTHSKSILKIPSTTSTIKKSATSISRKVRFSSGEDSISIKTFEEKFNTWLEAHMEVLKKNECLKQQDPCFRDEKKSETCSAYLYKNLVHQVSSDWRNENLNALMDPFNGKYKLINYNEMELYFSKHWPHFRTNLPDITLLPSSVMLEIEKNFITESIRSYHRKSDESLKVKEYENNTKDVCVCNRSPSPCDKSTDEKNKVTTNKNQLREHLYSFSTLNIFAGVRDKSETSSEHSSASLNHPKCENERRTLYTDCKRVTSWESHDVEASNSDYLIPFWQQEEMSNQN